MQSISSKVLLIGDYCQTITVVRSLAKAGYSVIVGCPDEGSAYSRYSRYASESWRHPRLKVSESRFIAALVDFLGKRQDIAYVFPIGERDIRCFMRHWQELPASIKLVMADPDTVSTCFDKLRLYEMASQLGIPQANFRKITNYAEVATLAEEIGFPCVIKANDSEASVFGKKALILKSATDISKLLPSWPEDHEFLILQKFASGRRHNCHFLADRGRLLAYFEQCVLRTDVFNGTGGGVDGYSHTPTEELRKYTAMLVERLNYSGVGCAQFLADEHSNSVSFLEVNPRLDATTVLPYYCGYEFPKMAVQYTEYRFGRLPAPPAINTLYPTGVRAVSLWRDIQGWLSANRAGTLSRGDAIKWLKNMLTTFFRGDVHFTWSWSDPLPAVYRYSTLVTPLVSKLAGKIGLRKR